MWSSRRGAMRICAVPVVRCRRALYWLAGDRHRFGSRGSGATQFEFPGGVTTTSEPNAAVVVADTGNRRVSLFRVTSDHYGEGVLQLNFFFGHQVFDAPTGVEYDPARGLLVVADQVHQQPTRDWRPVSDGRKDLGTSTGVARGVRAAPGGTC